MLSKSSKLIKYAFVFVLLVAQWATAQHNIEVLGESHTHGGECVLCVSEQYNGVVPSNFVSPSVLVPRELVFRRLTLSVAAVFVHTDPIRGPPV